MVERVTATEEALKLIQLLQDKHGTIFFYQSGGCCDGSTPLVYRDGNFCLGVNDICLGSIGTVPFYIHRSQYEYWKHTQLIIDAIDGEGPAFSLDSLEEKHFITRSRVYTDDEYEEIKKLL